MTSASGSAVVAVSATGRATGTFTYSGNPSSSPLDAVRFLVGDTNPAAYFLTDDEISFLITEFTPPPPAQPNVPEAAGAAAEAIAAELSREVTYSADGVSVSADTLAAKFYTVAEKIRTLGLRSDVVAGPDFGWGGPGGAMFAETYDASLRPLTFSVGMHDNYRAGQQDFPPPGAFYGYWGEYYWWPVGTYSAEVAGQVREILRVAREAAQPKALQGER